ncbi:MAG: (d)CMP kinase [Saprospiraceae bacterium]|nr:(d)CMP kinase [Saprospiraceae bacterium]
MQGKHSDRIIVAIDGHSSSGKSTLAKQLAKHLGYIFVDTGAMYRAVTLYFIENRVDLTDQEDIQNALDKIKIDFKNENGRNLCYLNGQLVEDRIRSIEVSSLVSEVSAISAVRKFLVAQQRLMGKNKGLVMDGRDIGTVVFPDAEVKFFVTADRNIRAQRRYLEFKNKLRNVSYEEIFKNIIERDLTDTQRSDSPLKKAEDAILIDNSQLNQDEQFDLALSYVKKALEQSSK